MLQDYPVTQQTGMNEHWLGVFDEHNVQFLALNPYSDSDLVKLLRSRSGWTVDFEDGEVVIFVRTGIAEVHNSHARTHEGTQVSA